MKRRWRNMAWMTTVAVAALSLSMTTSQAIDSVYCTNCGTEWTQLFNKVQMVKQLATQFQQLQAQINQYQNMIQNTSGVSQHVWGNALGDIQKLNALLQQSKALAFSAGNLDSQFAQRYQGYKTYAASQMNSADWRNKYNQWSREASDNALYALKAANAQNIAMQDENALMKRLQALSQSAQGRMEALQIANMMAAQNVEQVQKLRQLMMLQLQMQANYYQLQQDKEDALQAARDRFFQPANLPSQDGRRF
jgi:P-type conjugative transfer protein TrbJ